MEDVTNYINNVGKPLENWTFDVRLSYRELTALKALSQNPHPAYMDPRGEPEVFEKLFEDFKSISRYAEERNYAREKRRNDIATLDI